MSIDVEFTDCHVVVNIYDDNQNRWIVADPALDIMFKDERGNYIGISELRLAIIEDKKVQIIHLEQEKNDLKNHEIQLRKHIIDENIFRYYIKNMFRFSIMEKNVFTENEREYHLVPKGYIGEPFSRSYYIKDREILHTDYYITDDKLFFMTLPKKEMVG